ncbi:MAG: (d)CMP kinase, partial [Clostridia bacterium]|nr:(d)CMP kinase [Clostridia bacterium]
TAIRLPEASMAASNVSAIPAVRQFLFDLQRKIAEENNCLMDGRDIGSVVLPNADLKLFMTASPETRAQRRFDELKAKGEDVKYSEILDELNKRDYQDSHREIAPLKQADDAILFDTSDLSFDEVKNKLIAMIKEKING